MSSDPKSETRQTTRRGRRRTLVLIGRGLGLSVFLIVAALLAVQVDAVSTLLGRAALSVLSTDGSTWGVERVRVGGFGRVSVVGLHLQGIPNGGTTAGWTIAADSVHAALHLPSLLRKRLWLRDVRATGLSVQGALVSGADSARDSSADGGWVVDVDAVRLDEGQVELTLPGPDSASSAGLWSASAITLRARELTFGKTPTGTLDTLSGRFRAPGEGQEGGRFWASGALAAHGVRVDSLLLESTRSHVAAHGKVPLGWLTFQPASDSVSASFRPLNLQLQADPLHLADVRPFLPAGLADSLQLALDLSTQEIGDTILVQGTGAANVPGRFHLEARVTPAGARAGLDGRIQVDDLAPEAWGLQGRAGRMTAAVSLKLEGPTKPGSPLDLLAGLSGEGDIDALWTSGAFPGGLKAELSLDGEDQVWEMVWGLGGEDVQAKGTSRLAVQASPDWGFQGRVLVDSARVGAATVSQWVLDAEMNEGRVIYASRGTVGGGTMEFRGEASQPDRRIVLTEGGVVGVDLASLLGDTVNSRLNLRGSGEVTLTDPMEATFSAESWATNYGRLALDSLRAEGTGRGRDVAILAEAWLNGNGAIIGAAGLNADQGGLSVRLDSLRFADLDLRHLGGADGSLPTTDLNGRAVGTATRAGGVWNGGGAVDLLPSRVERQLLDAGRMEVEISPDSISGTARVTFPDGGLSGAFAIGLREEAPRLSVPGISFRNLDVASFMGGEEAPGTGESLLSSAISGVVTADLRGKGARNLTGSIGLSLASSRFKGATIDTAAFRVEFREGEADVRLNVLAGPNRLRGTGGADLSSTPVPFEGDLSFELPDAASIHESLDVPTALFAAARVEGQGLTADSIRLTSIMTVDSAQYGNLTVEGGGLEGTFGGGTLELDTAFVQMSAGSFGASGTLPRRGAGGRVAFEGQITRAESLAQLVGADVLFAGEATAGGALEGSMEDFVINGEAHISALLWNRVRVQDLTLVAEGRLREGRAVPTGRATLSADRIELPAAPVRHLDVEVVADDDGEIGVDASADIDDLRDASLSARVEPGDEGRSLHLDRFDFRADEDRWSMAYPTTVRFADGVAVDSLLISAGDQQLRARGRIPRADTVDFRASLEGFDLETVADLLGRPDLSGSLSASMDLHGTGMAPRAHVRLASSLEPPAAPPGELQADLSLGGDTLRIQASVVSEDGGTLAIGGSFPMAFSMGNDSSGVLHDSPLDMQVRADSLTLAWFDPFLPGTNLRRLKGILDGSARVGGTPAEPSLSGEMWVREGSLRLPALGLHLTSLGSRIAFEGNEVRADSLRVVSGDGPLSGSLALVFSGPEPPAVSGTLQARNFQVAGRADLRASVSGSVDLGGTLSSPSVSGRLEVERADVYLGDRMATPHAAPVTLTEEDYRELATVFGYRPPTGAGSAFALWDSTALDLRVRLNRDLWVRQSSNPEMAVQFTGDLDVTKAAGDSLQLLGTVEGVPGRSYVKQFGRRFDLTQGTVTLRGPLSATMVDLTAVYEVPSRGNPDAPEATISLQLQGTPSDLGLELTSTPVMGGSDLVSYLVAGRPAGELLDGGGSGGETDLARAGGALALARASSAVEAYAREQVGLDVVEITTDGLEGLTLLAGRYVSPELYLGVRQPLSLEGPTEQRTEGTPNPELEVELEAVRWLLLNLRAGGRSGLELFVRSRISYD